MYENSFGVENLTIVKKRFDLDTLPPPFAKLLCGGIYWAFFLKSRGCPHKFGGIYIIFN
jgi:hypothetical protein